MLNNVVLDVAIGLAFIFVLYSLLATAINEFLATLFAYRHRMLDKALEQMLDGKSYSYYWWDKVFNFFLWLYNYSKIKKMNAAWKGVSGMAINWDSFFSKSPDNALWKNNQNRRDYIKRRRLNLKAALFAAKITDHPLYKRKAENSWLYKKPAYLSAGTFSDILIDILSNYKASNSASPVLMSDIAAFVNTGFTENEELKKILNIYIEQANGDVQQFKSLIEKWFDDTMDRVSGWYKKQASVVLLIIGLLLAMTFRVSTIEMAKKLSADKPAREALVKNASDFIATHVIDTSHTSPVVNDDSSFAAAQKKLRQIDTLYKTSIDQNNMILGLGWSGAPAKFPQNTWFVIRHTLSSLSLLIGFLITAFAISMGAPFWFDLLNKFVNLRVSGKKPDDSGGGGSGGNPVPQAITIKVENKNDDEAIG